MHLEVIELFRVSSQQAARVERRRAQCAGAILNQDQSSEAETAFSNYYDVKKV